MRRIRDRQGRSWDVVVGRASWGSFLALFVPAADGEVRQAPLDAVSQPEAERALQALHDQALSELLERSTPREE